MTAHNCCDHCLKSLALAPRLQRILALLVAHPEWGHDPNLEIIRFRILDRGADASRVTVKTESRESLGDAA